MLNDSIRPLQAQDYHAVTEIYNAQNEPHHHLTEERPRFPTVAGDGLVGVKRPYRNRGVTTALLAHTSAWPRRRATPR